MSKTLPTDHVRYLYGELTDDEAAAVELQRVFTAGVDQDLACWEDLVYQLDQAQISPSEHTVDRILEASRRHSASALS